MDKPDRMPNVPPFVKFVASAVPMVFDNSLSYYEALCALWKYIQGMTDVINNNATLEEEYIVKFNELKTFVDGYFANLDVQEEINNKLDQMAEDGTLQEIITTYIQANVAWTFDTVADMKQATNLTNGSYAQTLGFHSVNDGGGALYHITNTGTANEMDIIAVGSLFANLINGDNVKQYGAYGDDSNNDSPYIQRAVSQNLGKTIFIPNGTYQINAPINITGSIKIVGDKSGSILKKVSLDAYNASVNYNDTTFNFNNYPSVLNFVFSTNSNVTYPVIEDVWFSESIDEQTKASYAIVAPHLTYATISGCRFNDFNIGIILGGWCDNVQKCQFFSSTNAIVSLSDSNFINNNISECYFNESYIQLRNAQNTVIENSQADRNSISFIFIDCPSVSLNNCSTEGYAVCTRSNNSYVHINGGDWELHSKDYYQQFFDTSNAGELHIENAYIHYADYGSPGEVPARTQLISNNQGGKIIIKNCKISVPWTYTDYLSGNGINQIDDYVHSNVVTTLNKVQKTISAGQKVEIQRLALGYNKKAQAKVVGRGSFDNLCVWIEANITAIDRGTQADPTIVDCDVKDNSCISGVGNASSTTAYITCEYDSTTREAVIYFNSSANYHYDIYTDIEFNLL